MSSYTTQNREISYQDSQGQTLIGSLYYPEHAQNLAAVLVFPEWWGRNEYVERRARELAEQGYAAFAVDMYGDKKTSTEAATANEYMMSTFATPNIIVDRATAALNALKQQPEVNTEKLAAIGFCYGGKVALDLARSGAPLLAVATFHANLSAQQSAKTDTFKAEVLVAHGEDDSMVSLEDVAVFEQEMKDANIQYRVDIYPNTKHGFTNPEADANAARNGVDLGYNPLSEASSIDAMYALLDRHLK